MSLILVERISKHVVLKLNRPDKLNALSWDLIDALQKEINSLTKSAEKSEVTSLVLGSSSPKAFCAGADLKERILMTEEKVVQTLEKLEQLCNSLAHFPTPTIAVLEGVAFGGGLELALACDLRVAHSEASMGLSEVNLGIIPGAGGTQRLPRIVGESHTKKMIFLAEKVSAPKALNIGLIHEESSNPWEIASTWSLELEKKGPLALRLAKEAIHSGSPLPMEDALNVERACYLQLLSSEDRVEGLKAFMEKRAPQFKGK
jgi:methylglutaconyl-CoA hydratase